MTRIAAAKLLELASTHARHKPSPTPDILHSPVFTKPDKWVSQPRGFSEKDRIQSYESLEFNPFALTLASPSRMTYNSRIAVPRDLSVRMNVSSNTIVPHPKFSMAITPSVGPKKKSSDPVMYYPKDLNFFRRISAKYKFSGKGIDAAAQTMFMVGTDFGVRSTKSVGWITNTPDVVERIEREKIEQAVQVCETDSSSDASTGGGAVLNFDKGAKLFSLVDGDIVFNVKNILRDQPELLERVSKIFGETSKARLGHSDSNAALVKALYEYAVLRLY